MTERSDADSVEERIRQAVAQERAACIGLAEQHLRDLQHGHGVHGERMMISLIHELEARGREEEGAGEGETKEAQADGDDGGARSGRGDPSIQEDRKRI